jgi:hypothetical protein
MHRDLAWGLVLASVLAAAAPRAHAAEPLDPHRLEWSALPNIGWIEDVGLLLGANATLARFDPDYDPYRWRLFMVALFSLKEFGGHVGIVKQNYFVTMDFPGLAGGVLWLTAHLEYLQIPNAGYYGIGQAAEFDADKRGTKTFFYKQIMPKSRLHARVDLGGNWDLLAGLDMHFVHVDTYPGSKLEQDADGCDAHSPGCPTGLEDHFLTELALGIQHDTRNHEHDPTAGHRHQLAVRFTPGAVTGNDHLFAGATGFLSWFTSLHGRYLIAAARIYADALVGRVPFYELASAGAFPAIPFPGGNFGVRGMPEGRLHGGIKLALNLELRSWFLRFAMRDHRFQVGAVAFLDVGRVWAWWWERPDLDETAWPLRFGTGAGLRIRWGETFVIKIDLAYSREVWEKRVPLALYFGAAHHF